jgi:lipid A 4'-phosphatase
LPRTSSDLTVFGRPLDHRTAARWLIRAFLLTAAVFVLWPGIDLRVTRAFYVKGFGFPYDGAPWLVALRWAIWRLTEAMILLAAAGLALPAIRRRVPEIGARDWSFVLLLYLIGPGLLVNGLLKSNWGRARPYQVAEFGGTAAFTPPLEIAGQCASNCSFVSGEGAGAVALAISILFLIACLRMRLPRRVERVGVWLAVAIGLVGPALRLIAGRHFLSDTIFAALLVAGVAVALHRVLFGRPPDGGISTLPAPR